MKKLKLDLKHCYGIQSLKTEFSFGDCPAVAIYAPNGAMKSSLAKTFQDLSEDKASSDRMFPDRETERHIVDENDSPLKVGSVLVVRPYDEELGSSEKTSTLLVNPDLRKQFEDIIAKFEDAKKQFLKAMKTQSKSKKDMETEISSTFSPSPNQFQRAVLRVADEVFTQDDFPFSEIPYDLVFDQKVLEFLESEEVKGMIEDYIRKYNELIEQSTYFKKGTFNYYNASVIAKTLESNGFFDASHSVNLNADESVEIKTSAELQTLIQKEKEGVTSDPDLRRTFEKIESSLIKNVSMRKFQSFISENEDLLPALGNVKEFKELVWKSYFGANIDLFKMLIEEIRSAKDRRTEVEKVAQRERTDWERVIGIFNSRFYVPFDLEVKNRIPVMLGQEAIPKLGFTFQEGENRRNVERDELLEVLSTGEKKAFYILNVIFEIEVRLRSGDTTVIVIDDVADSFDYKNKYAIVQYLKEISENKNFRLLILTHNFDFLRTIQSRFIHYSSCFLANRGQKGIEIEPAKGIRNVFVKDWKPNFANDRRKRIASIPFMRNLIEYTVGENTQDYKKLSSLLHIKKETQNLKEDDLLEIYKRLFGGKDGAIGNDNSKILDSIFAEANECLQAYDGSHLENKVVLSMASRLKAEQFMIKYINEPNFIENISENQTTKLLSKFKEEYPNEHQTIEVLDKVVLMTPENIHLNSFMYEPILDMSDDHLKNVYKEITILSAPKP